MAGAVIVTGSSNGIGYAQQKYYARVTGYPALRIISIFSPMSFYYKVRK